MSTKESDLVTAMMVFAARCVAEGDLRLLQELGIGEREAEAIRKLTVVDLQRLSRKLKGHFIRGMDIDRESFWMLLQDLGREREREALEEALIKADAPMDMMHTMFQMDSHEYAARRGMANLPSSVGRPPEPDEATSHAVWKAWKNLADSQEQMELDPGEYLTIHKETGASMRAIWGLITRWSRFEDLSN